MPYDVMSGLLANTQGVLADPNFSAWRNVTPWVTGAVLASANATGTGNGIDARPLGGPYGYGQIYHTISGNNATATLLGSPDSSNWFAISSVANTAGTRSE